jgi:hypothetical protein
MNRQYTAAIRDELQDLTNELQDLLTDLKLEEPEEDRPYTSGMALAYKVTLNMLLARIRSLDLAVYLNQDHLRFGEDEPPRPDLFTFERVDEFVSSICKDSNAIVLAEASDLVAMMDDWKSRGCP